MTTCGFGARARAFGYALASVLVLCAAPRARAQLHRATDPVMTPATSLMLLDDALAIDVNPAAIGFLPAASFAYLHAEVDRRDSWLGRGDALYFATPVIGPFALGVTLQSIRPGELAARPIGATSADRAMAALSLAVAPSRSVSLGITTRTFSSGNNRYDALAGIDAGMLVRPSSFLSLSIVARDLFVSREGFGTAGLDLGSSAVFDVGLRPFGNELATLDAALAVDLDEGERLAGRGGLTVQLPQLGTAAGLIEIEDLDASDPAWRVMTELVLSLGGTSIASGVTGGDGLESNVGWYAMLRAEGRLRPNAIERRAVLDVELNGMSPRAMIGNAILFEQALRSPRVFGMILRPRGGSMSLAYAQELRMQIHALRQAGKPVVCHLESASGPEYYACAGADRVLIDPAGDIRLMGSSTTALLFGETLRKIGVRADFVRIGAYKSAPEQLTQDQWSDAAREQANALLDDAHRRVIQDLSVDLQTTPDRVADIMDQGPHLAAGALRQKLVDAAVDEHDLEESARDVLHDGPRTDKVPLDDAGEWGSRPTVGVIVVDETIVDGENVDIPIIDLHMTGGRTIVEQLESMAKNPQIRAIVLRVDSPGGAVVASDQIWRAVRRARERKPVIASLGAVAASGGYYVASAADEIWADPSTVTGSIGIFYGKVDLAQLADKLGVGIENLRRGKHAGAESLYRPFTDEERAALVDVMRSYYRVFLERVAEGRGMSVAQVDTVARGRVYSGDAALRLGLVDRLGGFGAALARARERAGLDARSPVVVRPKRPSSLLDYALGDVGGASLLSSSDDSTDGAATTGQPFSLGPEVRSLVQMVATMEQLGAGAPLALMPFTLELR